MLRCQPSGWTLFDTCSGSTLSIVVGRGLPLLIGKRSMRVIPAILYEGSIMKQTVFVTGGCGCIGASAVAALCQRGVHVVIADPAPAHRLRLWMTDEAISLVDRIPIDILDAAAVEWALREHNVTHVLHLAALQTPACQTNRRAGFSVNALGTFNVFEAVVALGAQVRGLALASSVAAEGATPGSPPEFFYGVWKQAGEGMARNYALHCKLGSVSLEPYIVFGAGRDQGMTSALTKAVLAAVAKRSYHIPFGGSVLVQDVGYVGECFARAALLEQPTAIVCKIGGTAVTVSAFVGELRRQYPSCDVTWNDASPLPFPATEDEAPLKATLGADLQQPHLTQMIRMWAATAHRLIIENKIDLTQL